MYLQEKALERDPPVSLSANIETARSEDGEASPKPPIGRGMRSGRFYSEKGGVESPVMSSSLENERVEDGQIWIME
jgi:hypothetical protein